MPALTGRMGPPGASTWSSPLLTIDRVALPLSIVAEMADIWTPLFDEPLRPILLVLLIAIAPVSVAAMMPYVFDVPAKSAIVPLPVVVLVRLPLVVPATMPLPELRLPVPLIIVPLAVTLRFPVVDTA